MVNYLHPQVQEDLKQLIAQRLPWDELKGTTILITGATGMLASYVGFTLLSLNKQLGLNIRPVFLARNKEKLVQVYGDALASVDCLIQDVCEPIEYFEKIDFIFHAAGAASPYYILNDPVGIIKANVQGTQQVLELARNSQTKKVLFTSTREVYGHVANKTSIAETDMGVLDTLNPRNCYPESKRLAEALLTAYHMQYNINFNILRIAHTYGPGMQLKGDGRVMSDFINDALSNRDININSDGTAVRSFCYITDAVSAIFSVMLHGELNGAYNVANEAEPVTLLELAHLIQEIATKGKGVNILANPAATQGYTNYKRVKLSTAKLKKLGWQSSITLNQGLTSTLRSFSKGID